MTALTDLEATELAQRIINTMRPTPPLQDWVEELTGLHGQRAWRVFKQLRQTTEHGLTIGAFVRVYREDVQRERRQRSEQTPPSHCQLCSGSGLVDAPPRTAHHPHVCKGTPGDHPGDGGCFCSAAEPCRCTEGTRAGELVGRIHEHNDRVARDTGTYTRDQPQHPHQPQEGHR